MTRILRLLLIAAIALPYFGNAAAQNPTVKKSVAVSQEEIQEAPNVAPKERSLKAQPRGNDALVSKVVSERENNSEVESKIKSSTKDSSRGLPSSQKRAKASSSKAGTTVSPPSSATIEEWSIEGTFKYYSSGWNTTTDYLSYSGGTIRVAIVGNDIYVSGLCPQFTSGWVKGTISGTTATFATGQYYGASGSNEYWFVGEDANDNECDVVFNYDASHKKLTQITKYINNKDSQTGGSYYSYFMNTVIYMPMEATVCGDGTQTDNEYVPVYGYWIDTEGTESQMIYPATSLTGINAGDMIESITFYTYTSETATVPAKLGTSTVKVRMGETSATTITSSTFNTNLNNMLDVYEGTLATGAATMTIEFDTPYPYSGGNLVIDTYVTEGSSDYAHCYWTGKSASSGASYNNRVGAQEFLPKMTYTWSSGDLEPVEALDFEVVEVGSSKTLNAVVRNDDSQSATATLTISAPFSVASSTMTMNSGTNVIPVTFTPTDATNYSGTLTIVMNGETTTIDLKGLGNVTGSPAALRDSTFFAGINYEWTDSLGATHLSGLDEIATDPDQMIAMMREVYTNKTIPGNFKRGFTAAGADEGYNDVYYSGVGEITRSSSGYSSASYYSYDDAYGWDIPGDIKYDTYSGSYTYYYAHLDTVQYRPNQEGVTLLLVEVVDDFKKSDLTYTQNESSYWQTFSEDNYENLREYIKRSIKSVRVVTEAKRTGSKSDFSSGTLFKIDCDKMNKFFMLAKGQVRWVSNSYWGEYTSYSSDQTYNFVQDFCAPPCYIYYNRSNTDYGDQYYDKFGTRFFWHMFEQFSPVQHNASAAKADIYQELVNMETFDVQHDCMSIIPSQNHQFMMYGDDSGAGDCQDVRDLMFFVPDYRMMKWTNSDASSEIVGRDPSGSRQKFLNYNPDHAPKMGLYVIRQDEIVGAQVSGKDMYKLTLTWDSNLDDFLPSDQQVYELLQVVIDENGVEQYVPVYYMNSNGQYTDKNGNVVTTPVPIELTLNPNDPKTYTEVYVPMQQSSQQVTYAVRGQDISKFLNLKVSNKQDYIIPGLDPNEMIKLTDVTHYSRFNAQTVNNCYSNRLQMTNNALGLNNNIIVDGENGTKLTVIRSHVENVNGENTTVDEPIATITFNNHDSSSRAWTVTMNMDTQSANTEFPAGQSDVEADSVQYYAGYHANQGNTWSNSYSVASDGNITLSPAITIFDNFVVDVSENAHPNSYSYKVETNYPGAVYLVTNNGADYTNGAVWYAWTWNDNNDGMWVKGRTTSTSGKYMFTPMKANVKFVRMNPSGAPSWDSNVAWNQTGDLVVIGETFTLNGWLTGAWEENPETHSAYSNDIRIPVYKTDSRINGVFSKAQVDGDVTGYMEIDENLAFEAKVQYSSKTEILRYDAYRWGETEERYIVDKVRNYDDEDDIAPTGIAGNQDGSYTVSMNEVGTADYYTTSVTVASGENDKWAKFVDFVPSNQTVGTAYTYAPVVELFATGKDVNNKTREDYNTYGGPLRNAAMGKLAISLVEPTSSNPLMSEHKWQDENGNWYAYYNIKFNVDTKSVPPGYDIYKIRAWREINESLLGEEYEECGDRVSDSYKFEELTYPDYDKNETYVLGSKPVVMDIEGHEIPIEGNCTGTFGARKLRTSDDETGVIEELDACFFVRIYFTRKSNLEDGQKGSRAGQEPELPADGKYYVVEASYDFVAEGGEDVPTGVIQNLNVRQVVSEKYYNPAGIESDTPFKGVNIVVTRYSDGSTSTVKVLK